MWRVYYTDESYHTGEDSEDWRKAPSRGVAGIITPSDRVGRFIECNDFYMWPPWQPQPIAADAWGVMDYLLEVEILKTDQRLDSLSFDTLKNAGVKLGRSVCDEEWEHLHRLMVDDPDFPRKSGYDVGER